MANNPQAERFRTSVGGQALMEGIMMRGPQKICCAVRRPDGEIDLSYDAVTTHWYNRMPLVRGICNMAENLYSGYKYLMHSADISLTEEEKEADQSKFDKWLDEHTTPAVQNVLMTCAAFAGVLLEGLFKLVIFLAYMFLCTRMKEIHRMFEYHGAEHKTIACYEAGLPLTVENIRGCSRFHPRCGTSFLILTLIISIFLYAVLPWSSTALRVVYKLALFPLLVGISYEILKWSGRSHGALAKAIATPGLWLQRLTTFEPEDSMIEVAIAAVTPVLPEKAEDGLW